MPSLPFLLLILPICTYSQCQYVAFNWDNLVSDSSSAIRKYVASSTSVFLPPLPKLFGGAYNETFAKIPYPTEVCLQTQNQDTDVISYKFKCQDDNQLSLQIWRHAADCTGDDDGYDDDISLLFDENRLEYECESTLEPCQYISIEEAYFSYNDTLGGDVCNSADTLGGAISYQGIYAVDVCLENGIGSFKYSCDTRTATYTLTQYSDTQCIAISESMQSDQNTQCADDFFFDIIYLGDNTTASYDDTQDIIESAQSTFMECTSADEFELTLKEYCVAAQLYSINDDQKDSTAMTQFGPFGMHSVVEKKVSTIIDCDPCHITDCSDEWNQWHDTILVVNEQHTSTITMCADGVTQFVVDIQSINVTVVGIIFASDSNISYGIAAANDSSITIPTRVMRTGPFANRFDKMFAPNESVSTKVSSLSCNYRDGYPEEICVTATYDNIDYAGTYLIQNITTYVYNWNPIWIKQSYGGIEAQYIWLDAILVDDDTDDRYVELRWVISSDVGSTHNASYCTIDDVNTFIILNADIDSLSNFDATNCEWRTMNHNDTLSNIESAPYQCFNNLLNAPITHLCASTYQNVSIAQYFGTYYELATASAIYVQKDIVTPQSVAVLKRDYKYTCEFVIDEEGEQEEDEEEAYYGYYGFFAATQVPSECTEMYGEYSDMNWILYDSTDNKLVAYCDSDIVSVVACNRWFVWNDSTVAYLLDTSFDVDINECSDDEQLQLPAFNTYPDTLCFELNTNHSLHFIYSPVQYLWGEYAKLDSSTLFNERAIYQNVRLNNTQFETYLIWYDPADSWVFVTNPMALLGATHPIFDSLESIHALDNVIVAWCDNNDDLENRFAEECVVGWTVGDTLFDLRNVSLYDGACSAIPINFTKASEINDLCVSFYDRMDDCILPGETYNIANGKPSDCDTPSYFETSDWCNTSKTNGVCDTLDGNGIYTQFDMTGDRSYWVHETGDDDEKVFYYIYYHEILRVWVWSTDEGDYGNRVDNVQDLLDLGIAAYCLRWDLNTPQECEEFLYEEAEADADATSNASSIVEDCTINRDDSMDLVGTISAWVIVSCAGLGCCVFFIGFYREQMQKRHQKKAGRVSMLNQFDTPDTISEHDEMDHNDKQDQEKQELNSVTSGSTGVASK